jgi:glycosyltransferase involved in cell wall biosynthesis
MSKRITWVTFGHVTPLSNGNLDSPLASVRYRVLTPIKHLQSKGYQSGIVFVTSDQVNDQTFASMGVDVVIFSKSFRAINHTLAEEAKAKGAKIIFDICDNHFHHTEFGSHYQAMATLADHVTCNTEKMLEIAGTYTNADLDLIPDSYEGPGSPPHFSPGNSLKLGWFGHPVNFDSLLAYLPELEALSKEVDLELHLLTATSPNMASPFRNIAPSLNIKLHTWSLDGQWTFLSNMDFIIIPSLEDETKLVKSANRLIEAMHAGTMAITNPLPAYEPFRDMAWVGDINDGIRYCLEHSNEIPKRIQSAQKKIEQDFNPATVANLWQHAINKVTA